MTTESTALPPHSFTNNLTLPRSFQRSIYTGKSKLKEYPNRKTILSFMRNCKGIQFTEKHPQYRCGIVGERQQYEKYLKKFIKEKKEDAEDYFSVRVSLQEHKWGRIEPDESLSLSKFHRSTRHAFCIHEYRDADFENCEANVILLIMKANDISSEYLSCLEEYCADPKALRAKIIHHHNIVDIKDEEGTVVKQAKDIAKQLAISLINGGSYEQWMKTYLTEKTNNQQPMMWMVAFQTQVEFLMDVIYTHNQHIIADVLKYNPDKFKEYTTEDSLARAKKRSCMARFYQTIERQLQETAIHYLVQVRKFDLSKIVPCQDGFMVLKELWYDELLEECMQAVNDRFGWTIPLKDKPFEEAIYIPPLKDIDFIELINPKGLADRLFEKHSQDLLHDKFGWYAFYNNRWIRDDALKVIRHWIRDVYVEVNEEIKTSNVEEKTVERIRKELVSYTTNDGNIKSLMSQLSSIVQKPPIEFDSKPLLLGFDDGVLDLEKWVSRGEDKALIHTDFSACFRPYKPDDYISQSVGYDFPKEINSERDEKLIMFLHSIFPEDKDTLEVLSALFATGLDGFSYQILAIWFGSGGNAKGVLQNLMEAVLGNYYLSGKNDLVNNLGKANGASPDTLQLKNSRFTCFDEVSFVDNATMKLMTGNSPIKSRTLYSSIIESFIPRCVSNLCSNSFHWKSIPAEAELRRLLYIVFRSKFTDDESLVGTQEIKDGIVSKYYRKDDSVGTIDWNQEMKFSMLHYLLRFYQKYGNDKTGIKIPRIASVIDATKKYVGDKNLFEPAFNRNFVFTGNTEDTLHRLAIYDSIKYDEEIVAEKHTKQYTSSKFDEWLLKKVGRTLFETDSLKNRTKIIRGYIRRPSDEDEVAVYRTAVDDDGATSDSGTTTSTTALDYAQTPPAMPMIPRKK